MALTRASRSRSLYARHEHVSRSTNYVPRISDGISLSADILFFFQVTANLRPGPRKIWCWNFWSLEDSTPFHFFFFFFFRISSNYLFDGDFGLETKRDIKAGNNELDAERIDF